MKCKRCGSQIIKGFCSDETCPFAVHLQDCQAGWNGHPEMDPHPNDDDLTRVINQRMMGQLQLCSCHAGNIYVCDFCGVYKAEKPRCNKCEREQ